MNLRSAGTLIRSVNFFESSLIALLACDSKTSATADNSQLLSAVSASAAAPLPRPPHPTRPIFNLAPLGAPRTTAGNVNAAPPRARAVDDFRNPRRLAPFEGWWMMGSCSMAGRLSDRFLLSPEKLRAMGPVSTQGTCLMPSAAAAASTRVPRRTGRIQPLRRFILGVEGGGTRTTAVLAAADEIETTPPLVLGPSNLRMLSDRELIWRLREIAERLPVVPGALLAVAVGLAGTRTPADRERIRRACSAGFPAGPVPRDRRSRNGAGSRARVARRGCPRAHLERHWIVLLWRRPRRSYGQGRRPRSRDWRPRQRKRHRPARVARTGRRGGSLGPLADARRADPRCPCLDYARGSDRLVDARWQDRHRQPFDSSVRRGGPARCARAAHSGRDRRGARHRCRRLRRAPRRAGTNRFNSSSTAASS